MKFPRNRMRLSVALAGTLSAVVPLTVTAQLEEVVVTANKRATSLQDIPLAVSVVDAQIVERSEIRDLLDLQSVVPSLRVPQFQNSVQTNFVIRGFVTVPTTRASNPLSPFLSMAFTDLAPSLAFLTFPISSR